MDEDSAPNICLFAAYESATHKIARKIGARARRRILNCNESNISQCVPSWQRFRVKSSKMQSTTLWATMNVRRMHKTPSAMHAHCSTALPDLICAPAASKESTFRPALKYYPYAADTHLFPILLAFIFIFVVCCGSSPFAFVSVVQIFALCAPFLSVSLFTCHHLWSTILVALHNSLTKQNKKSNAQNVFIYKKEPKKKSTEMNRAPSQSSRQIIRLTIWTDSLKEDLPR